MFQKCLPMLNDGAKTRFMLKITEIVVADDDTIVVSGVLENKSSKKREDRWPVGGNTTANEPIIVVGQALAIVVSGRCESDQTRIDHLVASFSFSIHFGGRCTSVEKFTKVYRKERA